MNKTQRRKVAENDLNTDNTKETKDSVYFVSSVFIRNITTDIWDFRDVNHERKRDNPFNLCNLCS